MQEIKCPHCQNPIYDDDALLCHFCGESLKRSRGTLGKMRNSNQWVVAVIAAIVILSFLTLMF